MRIQGAHDESPFSLLPEAVDTKFTFSSRIHIPKKQTFFFISTNFANLEQRLSFLIHVRTALLIL